MRPKDPWTPEEICLAVVTMTLTSLPFFAPWLWHLKF